MRKFLGFMVMMLFAFPLTVNAEDKEQIVENIVDEENITNEDQEIPVMLGISINDSVSNEGQADEGGGDFLNGTSARIAGTWIQDANGWWYRHEDGSYTKNNWENINGTWFYFDANGYMHTGWLQQGNAWYYLWNNGSMATAWSQINGTWFYFDPSTGIMHTGWLQQGNAWYYLWDNGSMATAWSQINGTWYYFNPDTGVMHTGWLNLGNTWYYLHSNGSMATGWQYLTFPGAYSGNPYYNYFDGNGAFVTDSDVRGCSHGFSTFGDNRYTSNVNTLSYYSYCSNAVNGIIQRGVNNWNNGYVAISKASTDGQANMLFYEYSSLGQNTLAITNFFKGSSLNKIEPWDDFWTGTSIHLVNNIGTVSSGTVTHEIGHALGLSHKITNPNSIMCQIKYGRNVETVQPLDLDAVKHIY